jgi:hypothetical protein
MASGIFSLMRSISGTIGTAAAATYYEQRYFQHIQRYAEDNDLTSLGLQEGQAAVHALLEWAGELAVLRPQQTDTLLQQRLLAEATTVAYQDFFLLAALIGALAILPALPWMEMVQGLRRLLAGKALASPRVASAPAEDAVAVAAESRPRHAG